MNKNLFLFFYSTISLFFISIIDNISFFYVFNSLFLIILLTITSTYFGIRLINSKNLFFILFIKKFFLFFLCLILFGEIFSKDIFNFDLTNNLSSFLKNIALNINLISNSLILYTISLGFLIFYDKKNLNKLELKNNLKIKDKTIIILSIIIVLSFVIRVYNLGKLGLVSDEFTINNVIKGFIQTGNLTLRSGLFYNDTPLHIILTSGFIKVFGNNEFMQRLPSAIFGSLIPIFGYLISKELNYSRKTGLIIAVILAIHPWFIEYSRFGKGYIMGAFFYIGAIYFYLKSLNKNNYIIYGTIFTILGIFSHKINYILIILPFILLVYNIYLYKKDKNIKNIIYSFIALIIGLLTYYIFIKIGKNGFWDEGFFLKDFLNPTIKENITPNLIEKIKSIFPFDFTKKIDLDLLFYFTNSLPFLSSFIFIGAGIYLYSKKNIQSFFLFIHILTFTIIYIYGITLFDKINKGYLYFSIILIILFFGNFIEFILKLNKQFLNYFIIIIIGVLGVQSLFIINSNYGDKIYSYYSVFEGFVFRQDNKTPCEFLEKNYKKGDILITLGSPGFCKYYGNIDSDYYVFSNEMIKGIVKDNNFYDLYENSMLIDNYDKLVEIINNNVNKGKKVYLYSSYSMLSGDNILAPRINHIWGEYKNLLLFYSDKKIYTGKDKITSIYLFK